MTFSATRGSRTRRRSMPLRWNRPFVPVPKALQRLEEEVADRETAAALRDRAAATGSAPAR
jgi:hypothetical protein